VIADEDDVAISAVTAAELLVGVEMATPRRRERRRQFVDAVLGAIPVEDYDLAVARAHARLLAEVSREGRPRGAHDLIIAATAVSTNRVVVTDDDSGFVGLSGVEVRSV
jgi:tRNA(fMet)-specific endonuclease VapC